MGFILISPISKIFIVPAVVDLLPHSLRYKNFLPDYIGYEGAVDRYFNGSIDEVMIFNRSLNASEVSALYNSTANRIFGEIDSDDLVAGANLFNVYGVDLAGNVNSSDFTVNYDGVAPNVSLNRPVNGSYHDSLSVVVNASVVDAGGSNVSLVVGEGLVSWWRMDDGNATHVFDYIGSNNQLFIVASSAIWGDE